MSDGARGLPPGVEALDTFDEARRVRGAGPRGRALVRAAERLFDRLREASPAARVEVLELDRRTTTPAAALDGAWASDAPEATLAWRALYLEIGAGERALRVLVDPVEPGAWRRTPRRTRDVEAATEPGRTAPAVVRALDGIGVSPDAIDLVLLSHLRGQDLRALAGTARGDGRTGPAPGVFPRARWLVDAAAWASQGEPHPAERPYRVRHGLDRVEAPTPVERDVAIGAGCAWFAAPGWAEGQRSLAVRTPRGVEVWSAHGVAPDAWSPYHARLPGLRERVRAVDAECVPRGDALCRMASLDSMAVERALADRDPCAPSRHLVHPNEALLDPALG